MDNPDTKRSVALRHGTYEYANLSALERDIVLARKSLVSRSKAEGAWSQAERDQVLKDLDDFSDMLDEHMVWSVEIETYSKNILETNLRDQLSNLPDPFGSANA